MSTDKKKPGAFQRPGKGKSPRKRTTPAQRRKIRRLIEAESKAALTAGVPWHRKEFPALAQLLSAASAALPRRLSPGQVVAFHYAGQGYTARLVHRSIVVGCKATGRFIATPNFNELLHRGWP